MYALSARCELVAQICNMPYRRFAIGRPPESSSVLHWPTRRRIQFSVTVSPLGLMLLSVNPRFFHVSVILLVLSSLSLRAQDNAAQRHQMATNHLKRVAAELSAHCLSDIRSLDDWKQRRPGLRRQL